VPGELPALLLAILRGEWEVQAKREFLLAAISGRGAAERQAKDLADRLVVKAGLAKSLLVPKERARAPRAWPCARSDEGAGNKPLVVSLAGKRGNRLPKLGLVEWTRQRCVLFAREPNVLAETLVLMLDSGQDVPSARAALLETVRGCGASEQVALELVDRLLVEAGLTSHFVEPKRSASMRRRKVLGPCGGLAGNSFAALAMSDEHVDAASDGAEEKLGLFAMREHRLGDGPGGDLCPA
jgi:hypothetical protein